MWFRKPRPDPAAVASGLREQVFTLAPGEIGVVPAPGHERIWCVLMETGYPKAVASLVVIADGTTSLYFSTGGGIIGAGAHSAVSSAAATFIAGANQCLAELVPTVEHPLPAVGRVRFYARTFDGLHTAEAGEQELGEHRHRLSPLFHLGHAVITAVRTSTPQA